MKTKNKSIYLLLVISILISACSTIGAVSNQNVEESVIKSNEEVLETMEEQQPAPEQRPAQDDDQAEQQPPDEAIEACKELSVGDGCDFTWEKGAETGLCEMVQDQLTCSPQHGADMGESLERNATENDAAKQDAEKPEKNGSAGYNIEQAISDRAQAMTIAYDALAFLTGDVGSNSFFPPGKMADFWGFQYLRDNDPSEMGHAGVFLSSAALNTLNILTSEQRAELIVLAENQVDSINEFAYMRFILIDAFNRLLEGYLPDGATGLSEEAVMDYSAQLYRLDGDISYERAALMGSILNNFNAEQKEYFDAMVGRGMLEWPDVDEPEELRNLDHDVKVAVMTYAADIFSWYAGSVEADVYFCPERHGTYFGSFYLKDVHTMSDPDYAIPTSLTGNMGEAFLETLDETQSELITSLVDIQKDPLLEIVNIREQIAVELRKFMNGNDADKALVISLMEEYGALDGVIISNYAANFSQVNQSLTNEQIAQLMTYREEMLGELMYPSGAYLYSQAIPMPEIESSDFLFE